MARGTEIRMQHRRMSEVCALAGKLVDEMQAAEAFDLSRLTDRELNLFAANLREYALERAAAMSEVETELHLERGQNG